MIDYPISPNPNLAVTKIPDATPGIIAKYAFSNESALLTQVRHNRLIDVFLGITCYSLQNHLLGQPCLGVGQVETDEVYIGIDRFGSHYVIPVQAEVGNNSLSRSKIEQAIAVLQCKGLPNLICRAVGVHLTAGKEIALFEFEQNGDDISIVSENHYLLVPPDEITNQDLIDYRQRLAGRT